MALPRNFGVSGSGGFIGQALSELATSLGVRVVPINLRSRMHRDEVGERLEALKHQGVTDLVHLAWPASSTLDYKYAAENVSAGILAVDTAELCMEIGLHFYGFGSAAENRFSETPYSKSKADTRQALQTAISNGNVTWLRPHYVFKEGSWPFFLRESSETGSVVIQDNTPRDFIHINDVSEGVLSAVKNGLQGEVDIASGKLTRPSELLAALKLGFSVLQGQDEVQSDTEAVDISKLLNVSWSPKSTLDILKEIHGE